MLRIYSAVDARERFFSAHPHGLFNASWRKTVSTVLGFLWALTTPNPLNAKDPVTLVLDFEAKRNPMVKTLSGRQVIEHLEVPASLVNLDMDTDIDPRIRNMFVLKKQGVE